MINGDLPSQTMIFHGYVMSLPEGKSHSKSHSTNIFLWLFYGFPIFLMTPKMFTDCLPSWQDLKKPRSTVPSCGSVTDLCHHCLCETKYMSAKLMKTDFHGYLHGYVVGFFIPILDLATPPRLASMAFFDNFTKTLMICSTLIPLAMAAVKDRDVI